jgi:hypothetical protein
MRESEVGKIPLISVSSYKGQVGILHTLRFYKKGEDILLSTLSDLKADPDDNSNKLYSYFIFWHPSGTR